MKLWQAVLLATLLVAMPAFSACDMLGIGNSRQKQQEEYYRQQIEAIQKAQEANQKAQEEYYQNLQKGFNDYSKAYSDWQNQQLQQVPGMSTANQSR